MWVTVNVMPSAPNFPSRKASVVASLQRVQYAPDNGYHGVRAALSQRLMPALTGTLEAHGYFYDEPIEGYGTSSIYAATLEYAFLERLALLWGGSVAHSPYASLDASTLLRLSYEIDKPARRHAW